MVNPNVGTTVDRPTERINSVDPMKRVMDRLATRDSLSSNVLGSNFQPLLSKNRFLLLIEFRKRTFPHF